MSKLIALQSGIHEILSDAWNSDFSNLKQQALLFDQIGIYKLSRFYKTLEESLDLFNKLDSTISNKAKSIISELEWLRQTGIIFELSMEEEFQSQFMKDFEKQVPTQKFEDVKHLLKKIIEIQTSDLINTKDETRKTNLIKEQHFAIQRLMSIVMEVTKGVTTVTTYPYTEYTRELPNSQKSNIAQIVISKLPLPNNETPWEQIVDYRNDPKNQQSLKNLRRWIRKTSSEVLSSTTEIEEEFEWLINEFQNHMNFHKMKANTETVEVMVKAPFEVIENLVKLKFSKIPDLLFAIKKRQINLMEAELNAPGREMAYVIKAKNSFQSQE
jgi:hypothetical protein